MNGGDTEKMWTHRLHAIMVKVELLVVMDGVDMPEHEKCISWSNFIDRGESID